MKRLFACTLSLAMPAFVQICVAQNSTASGSQQLDRAHYLATKAARAETHTCDNITGSDSCHHSYAEGCTTATRAGTYDAYLSYLKNLTPKPDTAESRVVAVFTSLKDFQDLDKKSIDLDLGKQRQKDFANDLADIGQGNFYSVVGYLYYAIPGGIETCNCKLTDPDDRDYHIGIGFDADTAAKIADGTITKTHSGTGQRPTAIEQSAIIVEMTPHYRAQYHPSWTLSGVQQLVGKQVKVIGQLLVDNEHNEAAQNCAYPDAAKSSCWRGSAWEIHPVARFYVCTSGGTCAADSNDGWAEIDTQDQE
jgi:hypothetical protein